MELCFHLSVCFSFKTDSVILFRYIMFKKKEIENIFKIFKHEIQETIPNVGTKCGVRLCFTEIIFVSLIPFGSFIPNTF